jgi:hypothetical protein
MVSFIEVKILSISISKTFMGEGGNRRVQDTKGSGLL